MIYVVNNNNTLDLVWAGLYMLHNPLKSQTAEHNRHTILAGSKPALNVTESGAKIELIPLSNNPHEGGSGG